MQTILVVEDELPIADLLVVVLEDAGYRSILTTNGQEALSRLESLRPDLILSDIMMPVMDGRELCKRLQAHPKHSSIPVVLMSSAFTAMNLDGCAQKAFLKKPFQVDELVKTLYTVLAESEGDKRNPKE
jgi:two-component system alkaline phosphatase synthesis response regulator PhoP